MKPRIEITNIHLCSDGHPNRWYLSVWGGDITREQAEALKQQILCNENIVERLRDFRYDNMNRRQMDEILGEEK